MTLRDWLKGHFYFQMRQLTMKTVLSSTKVGGYVIMDVKQVSDSFLWFPIQVLSFVFVVGQPCSMIKLTLF